MHARVVLWVGKVPCLERCPDPTVVFMERKTLFIVAAGHGVELPFVFHTATLAGFNYSQSELELTNHMVLYWTNFAHHGNPNGPQDSPQVHNIILESVFPTIITLQI